ncbi:MAG TPA: bifunctional DNA-formamidopyrimidine glycosylase/DNA-(apurinic or apyrimidinic site) lyase [Acidimicrobiales bacterium]|nr:bifunctional DNA-formamidopyrimidine glycosylase/DNA-(apurinic or apyrimidinic site) lyase [Acidimicrobiales bacterium]
MPELPEVETVRRDIAARYVGDELATLVVSGARTVRRHDVGALRTLAGRRLTGAARHGKYLILEWEGPELLVVHLRMSGQLLAADGLEMHPAHTHCVFDFRRQGPLLFVDPRTFGEMFLPSMLSLPALAPSGGHRAKLAPAAWPGRDPLPAGMSHLGPDALEVTTAHLASVAAGRRLAVKALLADQVALAGIGNIYSDEICWHARVSPVTPAGKLKPAQLRRLVSAAHQVLSAAIEARGSTLADEQYCDLYGRPGSYQSQHGAYGRSVCLRCGGPIVRLRAGPRLSYCCNRCQR